VTATLESRTSLQQCLRALLHALFSGALVACATGGTQSSVESVAAAGQALKLTAALVPVSSNVRGSVDLDSGVEPNKSRVRIELRGAPVGAQHGWQIRSGRCGETTQVVGSPAAYRPIAVRADGTAELTMTVPIVLEPSQQYNVALFANRTDIDGVIACGNLTVR
jgi:hypothetical protein